MSPTSFVKFINRSLRTMEFSEAMLALGSRRISGTRKPLLRVLLLRIGRKSLHDSIRSRRHGIEVSLARQPRFFTSTKRIHNLLSISLARGFCPPFLALSHSAFASALEDAGEMTTKLLTEAGRSLEIVRVRRASAILQLRA